VSGVIVKNLCKQYMSGSEVRHVLRDVSFTVDAGKSLAIVGPSGSGKSTLLNIIGTLDTPTSGEVSVFGTAPGSLPDEKLAAFRNSHIGFVFQSHHLLPHCSILENVLVPSIVAAQTSAAEKPRERALRLIERAGLTPRMNARPAQLSGGECQRAAVVRALINSPRLVLADEPTGSLDAASAEKIAALLGELKREENVALIAVTHSKELAARMDVTLALQDGKLA
jgi:lipoprotein-releasing system ATP-binding protein